MPAGRPTSLLRVGDGGGDDLGDLLGEECLDPGRDRVLRCPVKDRDRRSAALRARREEVAFSSASSGSSSSLLSS